MLAARGGGEGHGRGIWTQISFSVQMPGPGKSSWVKNVQIPHSRSIIVNQKNSTNDQKFLLRQIPLLCPASPPPPAA